jgi:hypothetical protein
MTSDVLGVSKGYKYRLQKNGRQTKGNVNTAETNGGIFT